MAVKRKARARPAIPDALYHGTNPIAAAAICARGALKAEHPVDDGGLGAVVCASASPSVAADFATEYARFNSPYDVGVVFEIDGRAVALATAVTPYVSETASSDEQEFRIQGDVSVAKHVRAIRIVGADHRLSEDEFIDQLWRDALKTGLHRFFVDRDAFLAAMSRLRQIA